MMPVEYVCMYVCMSILFQAFRPIKTNKRANDQQTDGQTANYIYKLQATS